MFNIIGKRYWFFLLSAIIIVPGALALVVWHLKLGTDFAGGTEVNVCIPQSGYSNNLQTAVATSLHTTVSFVQPVLAGTNCPGKGHEYIIRSKVLNQQQHVQLQKMTLDLWPKSNRPSIKKVVPLFTTVSGTVAASTTQNAIEAVIAAAIAILAYITFAFRKMPHPFRYGAAAVIAMLHDVLVVVGIFAILGHFLNVEIDATFVTAMLTIIGFSVHDTIVIFDRIRENVTRRTGESFEAIVNHSVLQSFVRSINTSFTVVLTLGAIFLFSGESIRYFVLAMLIGIISGTYSSIFNASPILVVWQTGELKRILGAGAAEEPTSGSVASVSSGRSL